MGFLGGSNSNESTTKSNAGDSGSVPGLGRFPRLGRFPEEQNGYSFQYSCLADSKVRGVWQAKVHRVAKSWTRLSN